MTTPDIRLFATGRLSALTADTRAALIERAGAATPEITRTVASIIEEVRADGDDALRRLAERFDGVQLESVEVERARCEQALESLDPSVRSALEQAALAIATFHRAQLPRPMEIEVEPGVRLGRRAQPLGRVGVYAPGGRASYPSSVLMGVVPARIAGVEQVFVCSPPGPDGSPPAAVLAACALAGADRVFAIGGAGAIAAFAYGTATVPAVDKVVGPGNAWVTEAKRQLTGRIAIDCPAGPSEVLVLADRTADPDVIAAELIAQAEHDPLATAVLVTTDTTHVEAVTAALGRMLKEQPRAEIMRASLERNGALLVADDLAEAIAFAADYAPEHLLLLVERPREALADVRHAGTVFLGGSSSVVFGDYTTGANHVLPTAGLARAFGGLSTADFLRWMTYQELTPDAAARLAGPTEVLATAEGLPGHAAAARLRGTSPPARKRSAPDRRADVQLRASYAAVELYDPGRRPCAVDLSDNTNLFGPSPSLMETLALLPTRAITRYPGVYATPLKEALAGIVGVPVECVTTGCGSDDVIDSAMRAFIEPGDAIAYPEPTFGIIPTFARMNAAVTRAVPLGPEFSLDVDALAATNARLTYLCRPNNPTGTQFRRAAVEAVVERAAGIVLIDEAYADFAGEDLGRWAAESDRVVVLRTMSKAYGLAGLRVGWAVGPPRLIAEIEKSRGPYKVSGVAEAAALSVISHDLGWVRSNVAVVRENRSRLTSQLSALGLGVWRSSANFVLVEVPPELGGARDCARRLRERGVAVRPFEAVPQAGECIRVSIGPWPMMEAFVDALTAIRTARATPPTGKID